MVRRAWQLRSEALHNACDSSLTSTLVFRLYVCCDFQSVRAVYHLISKNKFENYRKFSGNNWKYFWEILERIIGSSRGIIRSSRGIIGSCLPHTSGTVLRNSLVIVCMYVTTRPGATRKLKTSCNNAMCLAYVAPAWQSGCLVYHSKSGGKGFK